MIFDSLGILLFVYDFDQYLYIYHGILNYNITEEEKGNNACIHEHAGTVRGATSLARFQSRVHVYYR